MDAPLLDGWESYPREDARAKCRERVHDIESVVLAYETAFNWVGRRASWFCRRRAEGNVWSGTGKANDVVITSVARVLARHVQS